MLIKLPSVIIDDNTVVEDLKLNVAGNHQARCKCLAITKDKKVPLDVIIYQWNFGFSIKDVNLNIIAVEKNTNKEIKISLQYFFISKAYGIRGKIGDRTVDNTMKRFEEVLRIFNDIFLM